MRKYWYIFLLPLIFFDPFVAHFFTHTSSTIKPVARLFSLCIHPLYWLGIAVAITYWRRIEWMKILSLSLGAGIIVVRILKILVGRSRPGHFVNEGTFTLKPFDFTQTFDAFPSSHAMTAFALATVLSMYFPKYRIIYWAGAICLSASRVILNRHFITDVAGGAVIAIFLTKKIRQVYLARLET